MSTESYYLSRVEQPVWFHANSNIQSEGEAKCCVCGEDILPGELVGEADDMQLVHEACCGEDE